MKNVALWLICIVLLVALFNLFQSSSVPRTQPSLAYSDFVAELGKGRVTDVVITGKVLSFQLADGRAGTTLAPDDPGLIQRLLDKKVGIQAAPIQEDAPGVLSILVSWVPLLAILGFWFYFLRQLLQQMQLLNESIGRIALNQAAGAGNAKPEIATVAESPNDEAAGGDEGTPG